MGWIRIKKFSRFGAVLLLLLIIFSQKEEYLYQQQQAKTFFHAQKLFLAASLCIIERTAALCGTTYPHALFGNRNPFTTVGLDRPVWSTMSSMVTPLGSASSADRRSRDPKRDWGSPSVNRLIIARMFFSRNRHRRVRRRLAKRIQIARRSKSPREKSRPYLAVESSCGIITVMEESFVTRPLVGRLIALDVRPTRALTFLGPAWAALAGAIASGGLTFRAQSLLTLLLTLFLCDAFLGAWRALWLQADWRPALRRSSASAAGWRRASNARWLDRISQRLVYFRQIVWPMIESEILGMIIVGVLTLSVAVVLGQATVLLTSVALLFSLIEGEVGTARGAGLRALTEIALPFLIALATFGSFSWSALVFALLFTLVYRALVGLATTRQMIWIAWSNLGQLAVVLILIAQNAPIGAGVVALGLLGQVLWQARFRFDRDGGAYTRRVQSYVLVAMLVAALSLWL